jgi:glycerol-1-phosphate dehydrogenase [NAD(P)+]
MELPQRVIIGFDIFPEIGRILKELHLEGSALIVSGPNVRKIVEPPLSSALKDKDHGFGFSWETISVSSFSECERISYIAKASKTSFLIGVGGGKSIDVAKLASFNSNLPFVSVPTSASHDGISSPFASVLGLRRPYSIVAKPPMAIIADIGVISSASPRLLTSGCGDLISKKTAVRDWELASKRKNDYFGKYAASLAMLSADLVLANCMSIGRRELEGVRVVVEALISAGVAAGIAGSSRPCSGSEHLFSHAMEILAPGKGLHGEKCGIGTIMMAKLHGIDHEAIREALQEIGAPTTAKEISATEDEVVEALLLAGNLRKERYTILDEAKLTSESARNLAKETRVI